MLDNCRRHLPCWRWRPPSLSGTLLPAPLTPRPAPIARAPSCPLLNLHTHPAPVPPGTAGCEAQVARAPPGTVPPPPPPRRGVRARSLRLDKCVRPNQCCHHHWIGWVPGTPAPQSLGHGLQKPTGPISSARWRRQSRSPEEQVAVSSCGLGGTPSPPRWPIASKITLLRTWPPAHTDPGTTCQAYTWHV